MQLDRAKLNIRRAKQPSRSERTHLASTFGVLKPPKADSRVGKVYQVLLWKTRSREDKENPALPRGGHAPKGGSGSTRPGPEVVLTLHVSGSMAAHRSGPLKQQNKAHKGGRHRGRGSAQRDGKGENVGLEGEWLSRFNCFSPCPVSTTSGQNPA